MTAVLTTVFVLFCLLQIKHMFADFFLQTARMLDGRNRYLHLGRAQHALVHAAGSAICFLIIGAPLVFILILTAAEAVVHFHIDWGKGAYSSLRPYETDQAGFWRAMGVDQTLHQFTYVAMVWLWVLHLDQVG